MADWSMLPDPVVVLIARRIQLIEDFVAFRQTCTSWRAATCLMDFVRSCLRLPLLMLDPPNWIDQKVVDERRFFSLSMRKICKVSLPEAREAVHCLGSKGWIIMVGYTNDMSLLHPLTRVQIPLPTHPKHCYPFQTAVLSASPSETSDYVLMVVFKARGMSPLGELCSMAFWKPRDVTWTQVEVAESSYWVDHLCYYDGKFYALASRSQVLVYDVLGPNPKKATKIIDLPWDLSPSAHLVVCAGRLLVIAFFDVGPNGGSLCDDLKIFELDVIKGTHTIITSLGDSTIFFGNNEGFSIDATKFPGVIEPNYIYFSNGNGRHCQPADVRQPPEMQLYDVYTPIAMFGGVWVNM